MPLTGMTPVSILCSGLSCELVSNIIAGNHGNDHEKSASAQSDADHGGRLDYNTYIEEFVSVFAAGCGSKKDAADQTGDVKRDSAACCQCLGSVCLYQHIGLELSERIGQQVPAYIENDNAEEERQVFAF